MITRMLSYITARSGWSRLRRGMVVASAALALAACNASDFLEVQDPDIVNPEEGAMATVGPELESVRRAMGI